MVEDVIAYFAAFAATLVATLALVPPVRECCRAWGMVDNPGGRRINRTPVPRGGGIALVAGVVLPYLAFHFITGKPLVSGMPDGRAGILISISVAVALLGAADDKWSLPPKWKLAGQIVAALAAWWFGGLGFSTVWPFLPAWVDCVLTVLWIVGAINAFNLIDGLDGLAAGIAFIATLGMAGALFFARNPSMTLFHLAFAGGLLGFLRYNYNPASVFLGDSGSMFIGFVVGTLPLATRTTDSFLVSVGVPMLAMGVPIFDTSLAILRRTVRRVMAKTGTAEGESDEVMKADSDHLHHRLLRSAGFNQRRVAWMLYLATLGGVATGLVAMSLESRAAGFWLLAFAVAAVVVFKDATVEMFDIGQVLNGIARSRDFRMRRRLSALVVPFYVFVDLAILAGSYFACAWAMHEEIDIHSLRLYLPVRAVATFVFLAGMGVYRTVWARALPSNYFRLAVAAAFGAVAGSAFLYYWPSARLESVKTATLLYAAVSGAALIAVRTVRSLVRDLFYAIDCSRMRNRKDVSRILVYGGGLRYRTFRRELVRTASANDRIIVGIIDDDILLKGRRIGGIKIYGTINEAKSIVNETNADAVVIACDVSSEWLKVVLRLLEPTGVKVTRFSFSETPVAAGGENRR